jgi:integrase
MSNDKKRRPRGSGSIYRQPGSRFWWICFYDANGNPVRESSKSEKKTVAQNCLKTRMAEVLNGTYIEPKVRDVTVDQLYSDEIAYLEKNGKKTGWFKTCWELRLKKIFGGRRACSIRRADLEDYQSRRMVFYREQFPDATEKKLSACETQVNTDLNVLRMILYRGHALEKLASVPPFPSPLQGAMERTGTVTETQYRAMLADCCDDEYWLRAMLIMAYTWGYRLRELSKMRCIQVHLDERIVYLPPRSTKNKKPRPIPISDEEVGPLRICLGRKEPGDFVFTRNGAQVKDFRRRWEKLITVAKAGHMEINERGEKVWVKAIFHDLRRTACSNLLAGGMSPANVRALVGHLSEDMTARYNKPAMATLAAQQKEGAKLLAALRAVPALPEVIIRTYIVPAKSQDGTGKEMPVSLSNSTG